LSPTNRFSKGRIDSPSRQRLLHRRVVPAANTTSHQILIAPNTLAGLVPSVYDELKGTRQSWQVSEPFDKFGEYKEDEGTFKIEYDENI